MPRNEHTQIQQITHPISSHLTWMHQPKHKHTWTHLWGSASCFLVIFLREDPSSVLVVSGTLLCLSALARVWESESTRKRDREQVNSSAFIRAGCRAARLKLGIDVWRINCKLDTSISRLVHATSERLPAAHQCQGNLLWFGHCCFYVDVVYYSSALCAVMIVRSLRFSVLMFLISWFYERSLSSKGWFMTPPPFNL